MNIKNYKMIYPYLVIIRKWSCVYIYSWRGEPKKYTDYIDDDECWINRAMFSLQAFCACAVPVFPAGVLLFVPSDTHLHPHQQHCIRHPPVSW